ncbi:type I restriction enzyme S subunit [Pseudomonas sp. 3296]|uniref:restriction endonuclease subunit S n=1 Tax=Pseudomonas sp. 3296 TaxID=2817753 RepID=UPI00285AB51B|nr:restriction endonuclease subunit S [Pseudomonas sp. 3296]MDR6914929.1 type I restriction enzyme S subunit [Pseudomonas sp. 3296]
MNELPVGWAETTLGEVADWGSGGTPSRSDPSFYGGTIPWIKSGELNSRYVTSTEEFITEAAIKNSSAKLFPAGSVAIAMYGATIGKTAILGVDASTNQACAVGAPVAGITEKEFLYRLLQNEKKAFIEKGKGGAQPNISQAVIKAHEIGLPPLAEQTRIAKKLDELLAQVDTLKARIDGVPALLKRFRQSVLTAAASGRLTEEWRERQTAIPSWRKVTIGSLCITAFDGPFGSKLKSDDYTTEGVRVVRLENIGHLNFIGEKQTFIGSGKFAELAKNKLETGDILFSSFVDEEVRVCRLPNSDASFINKADCFCLRIDQSTVNPTFVMSILAARHTYLRIKEAVHGATRPRINLGFLRGFEIKLPSMEEQTEIVQRIEHFFAFADQIELNVAATQMRVDRLTQSILAKAFRGELVPQDPNDEPASVLLERIKAQRAATPKPKRSRKASV